MRAALAQFGAAPDKARNLQRMTDLVHKAAESGASMLFFPEYSMFYAKTNQHSLFAEAAEPLDGSFVSALSASAQETGLYLAFGLFERAPGGLPYNTIAVIDSGGALCARYRKRRLYDLGPCPESEAVQAGAAPFEPVETPLGRLGILTCYELRFPALAAEQRERGASLLFFPAGWMAGPHKALQWRTLLAARAIETDLPVLGADQWAEGLFTGHTAAFAPTGEALGALQAGEGLITIDI